MYITYLLLFLFSTLTFNQLAVQTASDEITDKNNHQKVNDMDTLHSVSLDVTINASSTTVWDVITSDEYAKILGNEFDEGAFMASEWKEGSKVHFVYEPDNVVASGTITELVKEEVITIDYDFDGYDYSEKFIMEGKNIKTVLRVEAGPYVENYEAHKVVWTNWLSKVKELSEN